jgi:hypothetical protein
MSKPFGVSALIQENPPIYHKLVLSSKLWYVTLRLTS